MTTTTAPSTARIPDAPDGPPPGDEHPDEPDRAAAVQAASRSQRGSGTGVGGPGATADGPAAEPGAARRPGDVRPCPHGTPDLLAALPYQLGFRPEECLVAVGLRGPGRKVGLVARIDLDDLLGPAGPDLLDDVARHLVADDAVEVVVVVYSSEGDPRGMPQEPRAGEEATAPGVAERARVALERIGPVSTWVVTRDRYLGLACRDATCCPPGGRPLADLEPRAAAAWAATCAPPRVDDCVAPTAPAASTAPASAPAGRRRSAAAARSRWTDARLRASGPAELLGWRERSLDAWRSAVSDASRSPERVDLRPALLGRIESALDDTTLRDAVVIALIRPEGSLPDAMLRHLPDAGDGAEGPVGEDEGAPVQHLEGSRETGRASASVGAASVSAAVRRTLDVLLEPEHAEQPDPQVASAARAVLGAVVAHGRSGRQAPACTLLALLAWWEGDVDRARLLLDRAIAEDPTHRLAELLDRALAVGLTPGWMRRRC